MAKAVGKKFRKKNKRQKSACCRGSLELQVSANFNPEGFAHRKLQCRKLFKRTEGRTPHPSVPGRERLPPSPAARGQGEAPCSPSCSLQLLAATPQPRGFAFLLLCTPSLLQATRVPRASPAPLTRPDPVNPVPNPFHRYL